MGLVNEPDSLLRALNIILAPYKWKSVLIYLYHIIVLFPTAEKHLGNVNVAITALHKAGISLKFEKCNFFTRTVLMHIIRRGMIEIERVATASRREMK